MFKYYTRPLDDRDISFLRYELKRHERDVAAQWRSLPQLSARFLLAGAVLFATLVWFSLPAAVVWSCLIALPLPALALTGTVFQLRSMPREKARFEATVAHGKAMVTRVRSRAVAAFKDPDGLGPTYCFQLSDNKIVVISGRDYQGVPKMPNSDFEEVLIPLADREYTFCIYRYGEELKPVRTISLAEQGRLRRPDHLEVLEGRLEDLDRLLAEPSDQAG